MLPEDKSNIAPKFLSNLEFFIATGLIMFCLRDMIFPYRVKLLLMNSESEITTSK